MPVVSRTPADIIVIGAGMAGASAAAHLAENARVVLLEAASGLDPATLSPARFRPT